MTFEEEQQQDYSNIIKNEEGVIEEESLQQPAPRSGDEEECESSDIISVLHEEGNDQQQRLGMTQPTCTTNDTDQHQPQSSLAAVRPPAVVTTTNSTEAVSGSNDHSQGPAMVQQAAAYLKEEDKVEEDGDDNFWSSFDECEGPATSSSSSLSSNNNTNNNAVAASAAAASEGPESHEELDEKHLHYDEIIIDIKNDKDDDTLQQLHNKGRIIPMPPSKPKVLLPHRSHPTITTDKDSDDKKRGTANRILRSAPTVKPTRDNTMESDSCSNAVPVPVPGSEKWKPFDDDDDIQLHSSSISSPPTNFANSTSVIHSPLSLFNDTLPTSSSPTTTTTSTTLFRPMSSIELELCRRLDDDYERAIEDREVAWTARYTSVRQSAFFSVILMLLYLLLGCIFYDRHTTWSITDSLMFTIYTITTVGYGNHDIPKTVSFQLFTIAYILVGITVITVLGAHMYQFLLLEATRVQFSRDKAELSRRSNTSLGSGGGGGGVDNAVGVVNGPSSSGTTTALSSVHARMDDMEGQSTAGQRFMMEFTAIVHDQPLLERTVDGIVQTVHVITKFLRTTSAGRLISVFLPFIGLILFGAIVVGGLEGWTFVESIYWAVVTLTTVGFGDYYPTRNASIWFSIFYLPTSLFFMSFFLANVAKSYIRLHAVHVTRLETRMRAKIKKARDDAEKRLQRDDVTTRGMNEMNDDHHVNGHVGLVPTGNGILAAGRGHGQKNVEGFESLPTGELEFMKSAQLFGSPVAALDGSYGLRHREGVMYNSQHYSEPRGKGGKETVKTGMKTMKFVLKGLRGREHSSTIASPNYNVDFDANFSMVGDSDAVLDSGMSRSNHSNLAAGTPLSGGVTPASKTPSLATRMMVQERLARIIASDVAGYQSDVIIKENTLSITIDALKEAADKWMIPRRARKAFRAVSFQCLIFVGEHDLITKGGDALFCLNPFEFHGLFSPVLAAFGDRETMESWLASTKILADVELKTPTEDGMGGKTLVPAGLMC